MFGDQLCFDAGEINPLAAGNDCWQQFLRICCCQNIDDMLWRLFENLQQCAEDINDSMPLAQLVHRLGDRAHLREIYSWIALGYLRFDMRSEPLSMTTEVKFDVC